jgi:hypothetical protein
MLSRLTTAALTTALFAGLTCCPSTCAAADQPTNDLTSPKRAPVAPAKLTPGEWTGKVIYVATSEFAVGLENAQVRQLGGRTLVVGRAVDEGLPSPSRGRTTWVPMEKVTNIIEFDNVKEFLKAAEEGRAAAATGAPELPFSSRVPG